MRKLQSFSLPLGLAALFSQAVNADLPYSPTRIYLPSNYDNQVAYVLRPSTSDAPEGQLLALRLSSTVLAGSLPYTTISPSLPFLSSSSSTAFTSVIDNNGVILVYAGDCANGASGSGLWSFQPNIASNDYSGTWTRQYLIDTGVERTLSSTGANFLAAGAAFSSTTGSANPSSMYVFGGMCPTSGSNPVNWMSSASYSSQMLSLRPSSSGSSSGAYDISTSWSPATLIQEAGCSMTALQPTYSNSSSGAQFQQQNFVVLGGHTQDAFISTGKVAVFSLPQSNWTFLDVEPPTNQMTELTRSGSSQFTPRSGHSAVLSEDGNRIIIFGGWVGDTSQAAEPQVAVLNIGEGYGGSGPWSWTAPTQKNLPFASGESLYGHGAVILPGNVMMIVGGYSIPPAGTAKAKRDTQSENKAWYFFNITSNTWISSYSSPVQPSTGGSGSASSTKLEVGVGVGVGLVILVLFIAGLCGCVYYRKLKAKRKFREKELNDLADAQRLHYGNLSGGIDGRGGALSAGGVWDSREPDSYDSYSWAPVIGTTALRGTRDAERTGISLDVPSPTRGLRRNVSQRTAAFYSGPNRRNSLIHPIEERDEDETSNPEFKQPQMTQTGRAAELDPFRDPDPLGSNPVHDIAREDAIVNPFGSGSSSTQPMVESGNMDYSKHANGRLSPDKSERTSSTLSEQSTRSILSTISAISSRSARSLTAYRTGEPPQSRNPFNSPEIFAIRDQGATTIHTDSLTNRRGVQAYGTAMPSSYYPTLQAEGGPLLGNEDGEATFARRNGKSSSPTRVRSYKMALVGGLVGSVRRALPSALRSSSMTSATVAPPRSQLLGSSTDSSPTRSRADIAVRELPPLPRRAASDGGAFWDRKRGAKDWATDSDLLLSSEERSRRLMDDWNAPPADGTAYGARPKPEKRAPDADRGEGVEGDDDGGEDWDVETAVQSRNVQIMFSVPREKLRVVNAEVASLASEGDVVDTVEPLVSNSEEVVVVQEAGIVDESSLIREAGVMERVAGLEEMIESAKKED